MKRDNEWLERLLAVIWDDHFHDIERKAPIKIVFGKRARNRLGSISYDDTTGYSVIRITRLFTDPDVPELIVKSTIVHELCHYTHGFHSGLQQKHKHPHAGGVIAREFAERGLEDLYIEQKKWLKNEWPKVVQKHYPNLRIVIRRTKFRII